MRTIVASLALVIMALMTSPADAGFFSSSNEDIVKEGSMDLLPNVTIEKIMGSRFSDGTWSEFQTDLGENVVQFEGKVTQKLRQRMIDTYGLNIAQAILSKSAPQINAEVGAIASRLTQEQKDRLPDFETNYQVWIKEGCKMLFENSTAFVVNSPVLIQWSITGDDNFELLALQVPELAEIDDAALQIIFGR